MDCADNRINHHSIEPDRFVFHSLFGHALTNWIALIERVRLSKTDLLVPRFGPRSPIIARQSQAITRFDIVIPKRSRHERTLPDLCKAGDGIAGGTGWVGRIRA